MKILAIGFFIILILILISFAVINLVRTIRYNDTSSESQELAEKVLQSISDEGQKATEKGKEIASNTDYKLLMGL